MREAIKKILQPMRDHPVKWVLYFAITLFAVSLEMGGELLDFLGISDPGQTAIIPSMIYQKFATVGYRKPRAHFVSLVVMSNTHEPKEIFANFCKKREFEAALLRRLQEFAPSVIVLDFWYDTSQCNKGDDAKSQKSLEDSIQAVSPKVPLVLGWRSHTSHEYELEKDTDLEKLISEGFGRTDQVLDEKSVFSGNDVSYALLRLNADTRRVPLFWNVYENKAAVPLKKRIRVESLAYKSAVKSDAALAKRLEMMSQADEHAFTSFIPEDEFNPISAVDLLCAKQPAPGEDWRKCKVPDQQRLKEFKKLFTGKVVVVGENSQQDHYQSVFGSTSGYVLQANYMESLLDDRCLRPIPPIAEFVLALLGILGISFVFTACEELEVKELARVALGFALSCLIVLGCAVACSLIGIYLGYFVGFWLTLIPVPLIELIFVVRKEAEPAA